MKPLVLVLLAFATLAARAESLVAPGATLKKLAAGFAFTEGPTCDANGNLYFTDQPNDRILKWSVRGKLSVWLQPAGRVNGMMFDAQGNLIACAEERNELWSVATNKAVTVLVTNVDGRNLNGPNDLWVAPDGSLYFTDPFYKRGWADTNLVRVDGEKIFFLSADRRTLRPVIDDFKKPNGITGSPDGKTLYATDIRDRKTWRYDILPDGSLTNKSLFCSAGSDGMTIDERGNLYLCATGQTNGVSVFNPAGELIERIPVPAKWSANVSFGGKDHRTLFITASDALYAIKLRVRGGNPAK